MNPSRQPDVIFSTAADDLEVAAGKLHDQARALVAQADALLSRARTMRGQASQFLSQGMILNEAAMTEARERSCVGKKRYRNEEAAASAARAIKQLRDVELRLYRCGFCDCLHFTSKTLEQFVRNQERTA